MSKKYGGRIPIEPDDFRDKPREVRDFKVEVRTYPFGDWNRDDLVYVKATALVATDDTGQTFVRRKIGYKATKEFLDGGQLDKLKAQMLDAMARLKHEEMGAKE